MKFGVNILNFGPGTNPETLNGWIKFAEETGFHLAMISDHVAITPDVQTGFPAPFYDPFVSMGWLASMTKEIELGTTVTILPYRHPLLTARMAANIDQLSEGRFILGIGVGWAKQEYKALGVSFKDRGALTSEYLEVIKTCWTTETASYEGQFISFENVHTGPAPARKGGLPIWVGGSSDAALKRAARFGDAWHPYRFTIDWLKDEALPKLRAFSRAEERPTPKLCPRMSLRLVDSKIIERGRAVGHGNIDQIRNDLKNLELLGAEYVLLDTYAGNPDQNLHPERDWAMLSEVAERIVDLSNQSLR